MTWQHVSLGDVLPFRYGKGLPARKRTETGEYSVVSSAGVTGTHDTALTSGPSVVIGRKGTIGATYYCPEPVWPIDTTFYVEPSESVEIRFAYYLLSSMPFRRMNNDSAVPGLNRAQAERLPILLPPLEEQRAIAATLGSLDDKIESNQRIVKLLHQAGKALFEAAIADGASSVTLSEMVDHKPGKYLARADYKPGAIPVYGSNSLMGSHNTALYDGPLAVMARIGSYCGNLVWSNSPVWVNNNASALIPHTGTPAWVLQFALEAIDMTQYRAGTGQPFIAVKSLMGGQIEMPDPSMWEELNERLKTLSLLASQRQDETLPLKALRDALLPELLSGRVRVPLEEG